MKNKNLLIGAGVVIVGYLLWKKSQSNSVTNSNIVPKNALNSELELKRKEAQLNLDNIIAISDTFNKSKQVNRNGVFYQIDNNGKDIGYWKDSSNFIYTNGNDKLSQQYTKNIKDLGFTFISKKVLTPSEYEIEKSKMF